MCARLQIRHETIVSTQGESYKNWMETHFNIQRRLYDYQCALAPSPSELEQRHQQFIQTYNTTAHHGLLKDQRLPPIPLEVLGTARGRQYRPDELARRFATMLFPRTTNRYGCVTLHSYHFYVEEGLPQTQVLLWVYGEQLRAVFEDVVVAESHCRYDGQTRKVHDIRDGVVYPTRFLSPQGTLIPLNARAVVVVYRSTPPRPRAAPTLGGRQLLLFARASAGGWEVRLGEHGAGHGRRHARGAGDVWPQCAYPGCKNASCVGCAPMRSGLRDGWQVAIRTWRAPSSMTKAI